MKLEDRAMQNISLIPVFTVSLLDLRQWQNKKLEGLSDGGGGVELKNKEQK